MKRAMITGVTGQDGSYLSELLLDKGYEVHGIVRRSSTFNRQRIDHLRADPATRGAIATAHLSSLYHYCPDHYDAEEAFRHARFAHEAQPGVAQAVLSYALYRRGQYAEARKLQAELFAENPEDESFILAMSLWHLGERAEAREFYDRSVAWMEEHFPERPDLIPLRREAAELLGM